MTTIKVTTMDTELEFAISSKTRGRELFFQVSRNIGLRETWFFGLMFQDSTGEEIWIDSSKKTVKDLKTNVRRLKYRVKYYPEDVQELIEDLTINYFYLQIRSMILSDKMYCPPDTCVLLASYAAQARHGDFNKMIHNNGFLTKEKLLPERVYNQHNMKREEWDKNIVNMWQKHSGMMEEVAQLEYLKLVQNLEMYGINYFDIYNRKGTNILLGVSALGLNIYRKEDRLNPTLAFPWSEISNINFRDKKFTIKSTDRKGKDFVFFSADARSNKRILNIGIGNHTLYVRRRKPDTLEVMQMKAKSVEQRKIKIQQREKLQFEVTAREQAEKREQHYQKQIRSMKEEMERSQAHLQEAQKTIKSLQEQLRDLHLAKEQLEEQQVLLHEMMLRLEHSKNLEATEQLKLEQEIDAKRFEVNEIRKEVEQRDQEARYLQEKVDEARKREELRNLQLIENGDLEQVPEGASNELPEIIEVNEQLRDQLKALQDKLAEVRDETKDTPMDKIHRENIREGRNKYKTLNEIRKGNTVRRVDMFENM